MRKPTAKECFVLQKCLDGLTADIQCLTTEEPSSDVHGTTRTNLKVIEEVLTRLEKERG